MPSHLLVTVLTNAGFMHGVNVNQIQEITQNENH